jgi:hypothetical protein
VQIFQKLAPPTRKYAPLDDVIEPQGKDDTRASRGAGSGGNQGDSEN